jgi:predicted Zn-ribbon and HTH transcriptional regulator
VVAVVVVVVVAVAVAVVVTLIRLLCRQCGHRWVPRIARPVDCPKCRSRRWNEPKEKK